MLTQERLKELVHYDPETGIFTLLTSRGNKAKVGDIVGHKHTTGYVRIKLDGKLYEAHRLVWLYMYDIFPEKAIDHKNEIKHDNRIVNLRLATTQENRHNVSNPRTDNTSGFRGVSWDKTTRKWRSQIAINGKVKSIGYFNTASEASEAYFAAKRFYHPFWEEKVV